MYISCVVVIVLFSLQRFYGMPRVSCRTFVRKVVVGGGGYICFCHSSFYLFLND